MVAVRNLTPALVQFLFDLLQAGRWVMLPAMEGNIAVTVPESVIENVSDDFPERVVCQSAPELQVQLTKGFGAWKKYRDHVVGK